MLVDISFYTFFFVLGGSFVLVKLGDSRVEPVIVPSSVIPAKEGIQSLDENIESEYKYVASSRGKYFYPIGSKRADGLSEKNKMYFSTPEEAKKLGFKPHSGD
jgi:hypothetical protein